MMLPSMNLDLTLGCGQVFRWFKDGEWWSGVIDGQEVCLKANKRDIEVRGELSRDRLREYFRAGDDLEIIYAEIAKDGLMSDLTSRFRGLRLIRQDPWECSLSYLLATNANVPRIQKMVDTVCRTFGPRLPGGRHAFPTPSNILDKEEQALKCGLGYRCGRMVEFAHRVEEGHLDFDALVGMSYTECISYLKGFEGIGDKVADCIALFSLDHLEAFPVDVRIRRVMDSVYGITGSYRVVRERGQEYFGKYAGYAQELLYHWDGLRGT
jgi:N-glycosylase/DNA lyase